MRERYLRVVARLGLHALFAVARPPAAQRLSFPSSHRCSSFPHKIKRLSPTFWAAYRNTCSWGPDRVPFTFGCGRFWANVDEQAAVRRPSGRRIRGHECGPTEERALASSRVPRPLSRRLVATLPFALTTPPKRPGLGSAAFHSPTLSLAAVGGRDGLHRPIAAIDRDGLDAASRRSIPPIGCQSALARNGVAAPAHL